MIETRHKQLPYPPAAMRFVREGLPFTVARIHGEPSDEQEKVERWMFENDLDHETLEDLYESGRLPAPLQKLVRAAGGPVAFNRHVSGQQLCWGLREYAIQRWGLMARAVLRRWHIHSTLDFGRIVFRLIDEGNLRKQATDTLEDFKDVYDFNTVFDCPEVLATGD